MRVPVRATASTKPREAPEAGDAVGTVAVGDSVTLYIVQGPGSASPDQLPDAVRSLTRSVEDASVATIRTGADGRGVLVGRSPGRVNLTTVIPTHGTPPIYSCQSGICQLIRIEVVAR